MQHNVNCDVYFIEQVENWMVKLAACRKPKKVDCDKGLKGFVTFHKAPVSVDFNMKWPQEITDNYLFS